MKKSITLSRPDSEIIDLFFCLRTRQDVADLLDVDYRQLIYHLHIAKPYQKYSSFDIPKKKGGVRRITAPISALKIIQRKLAHVLSLIYKPKPSVHGFVKSRSIVSNARYHVQKRFVLNIDLEDFFPSINFGRVRGLFIGLPYGIEPEAATVLAQICCHENTLPQGAPTSPIISNMICAQMDSQLQQLAKRFRCMYTRYADDITFSTSIRRFPQALAFYSEKSLQVEVGDELNHIVTNSGFKINQQKIRLNSHCHRQEVTGIVTNSFTNVPRRFIRELRAMFHAWEKFGLDAAEAEFHAKYDNKHRSSKEKVSFKYVVKGKIEYIGMIRGVNDPVYIKFRSQLKARKRSGRGYRRGIGMVDAGGLGGGAGGHERRHGRAAPGGGHGCGEEGEQRAPLLGARRMHAQDALDKAAARRAPRAETPFPPQHGMPQRPLGRVIGRLHALDPTEGPQRLPLGEQIATEPRNLGMRTRGADRQLVAQGQPDGDQRLVERHLVDPATPVQVPEQEDLVRHVQEPMGPARLRPIALGQSAQIADQVRPAELALIRREVAIGAPAVGADDPACGRAEERLQRALAPAGVDAKAGGDGADRHPQPPAAGFGGPARFIGVDHRRRVHHRLDGRIDRRQGLADPRATGHHTAGTQREVIGIPEKADGVIKAEPIDPPEQPQLGRGPWPEAARRHIRREGRGHHLMAVGTIHGMLPEFGNDRADLGELPDLGALGGAQGGQVVRQRPLTAGALGWAQLDPLLHLVGRHERPMVARMPWLRARLSPPRHPGGRRWGGRGIAGGWFGGILGGLAHLGLQIPHLGLERGQLGALLLDDREQAAHHLLDRRRGVRPVLGGNPQDR